MLIKEPDSFNSLIYTCKDNNKIAYKTNTKEISYDTFFQDVISAQRIISQTISSQNIILSSKPSYEWIVLYFGLQLAGKTAILADDKSPKGTLFELCKKYNASTVVYGFNKSKQNINISHYEFADSNHCINVLGSNPDIPHISTVIFTSGTSELTPKGVALSEAGLLSSSFYGHRAANVKPTDTLLHILPFYHAFGLAAEVIAPIMAKTTLCFGDNLGTFVSDINHFKITAIYAVPQIIEGLLFRLNKTDLPTLKKITNGSAPLSKEIVESILSYNLELHISYGLSECSPCVAVSKSINSFDEYYSGEILPCCDVIISPNNEICISGSNVMIGYYDGTNISKNNFLNELFHSGDTGYLKNNKLYVTGRFKDILVFDNGKKYNKSFFESKILKITSSKECYVFSNKDNLNIILHKPQKEIDLKAIIEVMPQGIKLGDIYERFDSLAKTKLKKVINSPEIQLLNCKKLN